MDREFWFEAHFLLLKVCWGAGQYNQPNNITIIIADFEEDKTDDEESSKQLWRATRVTAPMPGEKHVLSFDSWRNYEKREIYLQFVRKYTVEFEEHGRGHFISLSYTIQ